MTRVIQSPAVDEFLPVHVQTLSHLKHGQAFVIVGGFDKCDQTGAFCMTGHNGYEVNEPTLNSKNNELIDSAVLNPNQISQSIDFEDLLFGYCFEKRLFRCHFDQVGFPPVDEKRFRSGDQLRRRVNKFVGSNRHHVGGHGGTEKVELKEPEQVEKQKHQLQVDTRQTIGVYEQHP